MQMCRKLRIRKLCVAAADLKTRSAVSGKDQTVGPLVLVGKEYLDMLAGRLEPPEYHEAVTFILGHEFTHICHRDYSDRASAIKQLLLMAGFLIAVVAVSILLPGYLHGAVRDIFFTLLLLAIPATFRVLANDRYWKQTAELRADRRGMELSGTSWQVLEKILAETGDSTYGPEKDSSIRRFVDKFSEIDAHPPAELRIRELKRGRSWRLSEYFRYVFILKAWKR